MGKKTDPAVLCPLETGYRLFGGKWDSRIICVLAQSETARYGAIKDGVEGITDSALTASLKKLVDAELVTRVRYNETPPRVEYSLTERGRSVVPIIRSICDWTDTNSNTDCNSCDIIHN